MITIRKEVLITQGAGPYTYQWINSSTGCGVIFSNPSGSTTSSVETDVTFSTLACITTAAISLQIIDAEGCSNEFPITFTNPCETSPITSFSQQVNDATIQLTAITTNQNLTYGWLFDDSIFSLVTTNENNITLTVNESRPNVASSNITLLVTDTVYGCSWTETYTYNFCQPTALNETLSICQFEGEISTASICFDATSCAAGINWSTLELVLPSGFTFAQSSDGCGIITAGIGTLEGSYTGTWTVNDLQGGLSSQGTIFISLTPCFGGTSCIAAPAFVKSLTCEDISLLPGVYPLVDLDDLVVTGGCAIDWSTFYFVAGLGQTTSGTGIGAILNTTFGSVSLNANHELVYTFTSQPTGSAESVTWSLGSFNGDQTGNVQILISYDCTAVPVAVDDAFTITCEEPYPFHDILANDTGGINPSSVAISTYPTEGTVIVNAAGEVQYDPLTTTIGDVTFGYQVFDYNNQLSNEAIVTITVICAGQDTIIDQCGDVTVTPFDLLGGVKTENGTWVRTSVSGPAAPGTFDGTLDFTGEVDGVYTYEYTVTDGPLSDTAILTINHINDCCVSATVEISVLGESIADLVNGARVRVDWDFGVGNVYTGTIDILNQATAELTTVTLVGASSTGSSFLVFDYSPAVNQDHPVTLTFNLVNVDGCTCTAIINLFDIPQEVNIPITTTYTGSC